MSKKILLVLAVAGLFALIALPGCQPPTSTTSAGDSSAAAAPAAAPSAPAAKGGTELARVGDSKITVEEFESRLEKIPPFYKKRLSTTEGKKDFLDRMVLEEIYYIEGLRRGLDKDPEFVEQLEAIKKNILASKIKKEILEEDVTPTDEEVRQAYEADKEEYKTPEQLKLRHILLKVSRRATPEEAAKSEAKAKEALAKIKAGESFAKVAEEYSEDRHSSKKGGEIPPVRAGVKSKEFDDAAWALDQGEVSGVFKDRRGYNILMLEETVPASYKEFDKVAQQIKRKIENEKRKEALDKFNEDLKAKTTVVVHEELLAEIGPQPDEAEIPVTKSGMSTDGEDEADQ